MRKDKRKSSVTRKMIVILASLGIITGLMCFLNVMAYVVLGEYSDSLKKQVIMWQNESGAETTELVE